MTITEKQIQEARDRFAEEYAADDARVSTALAFTAGWDKALEIGRELGKVWAFQYASGYTGNVNFDALAIEMEERARKLMGGEG